MTTIACNKKMMAADTQVDESGLITHARKVFEVNGDLIGFAGLLSEGLRFVEWYQDKDDDITLDETSALVLTKEGRIFSYETHIPMEILEDYSAIGSGAQAALVSMDQGHTPSEAIKIASKRDAYTGSEVYHKELG